jgi:integrase
MSSVPAIETDEGWGFPKPAPIPFADFVAELLTLYEPPLRSARTRDRMRHVLRVVAELLGPDGTTAQITPQFVARFIANRPESETSVTTHSLLAYLRAACNYAKSRGYMAMTPFDFRKKWVKVSVAPKKRHHSIEDIRRVFDTMKAEIAERTGWARWRARRTYAVASTVAFTGLRACEAVFLRLQDIDLDKGIITLASHKGRPLKTEASAAPVPIPPPLIEILEDWISHRLDPFGAYGDPISCDYLFPNVRGTNAWWGGTAEARPLGMLKAAGERAGVKGVALSTEQEHTLRINLLSGRVLQRT